MTNISSLQNNNLLKSVFPWLIKSLGVSLFIYILTNVNWEICFVEISKISIFSFLIALTMIQLGYLIKAKRWQVVLSHYKVEIPIWKLYKIFSIGTFLGLITPGKIGDFGRLFYIKNDIDIKKGLSSLFIDRIFDLISLGVLGFCSLIYFENNFKIINKTSIHFGWGNQYFFISALAIMLILYLLLRKKIISIFKTIIDGFKNYISFLKQLLLTLISMVLIYGAFIVISFDMNIEINYIGLFLGIILIGLLSLIPITILGLGVREVSMVYIFELYGLGFDKAIAMSLIMFLIQLISTAPGIFWFSKKPLNISNINKNDHFLK
jgi:glycosyltransferase 2 family protein